ncbi:hypothetical protein [Halorhabdus salina]|uniref:hypothetical protein n=1 Tax=Halorhabdus salina TaxID=2750670 RepID=UPI0015EFB7C1|nr:hypothetical protein [Halorhabdus salina]
MSPDSVPVPNPTEVVRTVLAETVDYVSLLATWFCLNFGIAGRVPGMVLAGTALFVLELLDRRPSIWSALVFTGASLFFLPVTMVWLLVPGMEWVFVPARIAGLAMSGMIAFRWGLRGTGRHIRDTLDTVVSTPPRVDHEPSESRR